MNYPWSIAGLSRPKVTNAAEGLPRRAWTVAELEQMVEAGILPADERIELIGGDVVVMSPKENRHELLRLALNDFWVPRMPKDLRLAPETTFRLTPDTYLEPDFLVYPKTSGLKALSAETAAFVVEISDSSLGFDLGQKAALYAGFGIAELWVIDAVKLRTHIHREPTASGYSSIHEFGPNEAVEPRVSPNLRVILADLELV